MAPGPDLSRRDAAVLLAAVLLVALLQLVLFAALDHRPPNDHDLAYIVPVDLVDDWREAGLPARARMLWDRLAGAFPHPQGPQAWLLLFAGSVGYDRLTLRLSNAPWLLLLVGGAALAARQAGGTRRAALLAGFAVATLPLAVNMSRKWFPQFHAASVVPLGLAAAFALMRVRSGGLDSETKSSRYLGLDGQAWLWGAFGAALGLRAEVHPIALPDGLLLLTAVAAFRLLRASRNRAPLRPEILGLLVAAASAGLAAAPRLFAPHWIGDDGRSYLAHMERYLTLQRWRAAGLGLGLHDFAGLVRTALRHHFTPALAATLLLPGLLAAPLAALRRGAAAPILLLAGLVVAQLPVATLTWGNSGYFADWLHLHVEIVLLAVLSLDRVLPGAARRAWPGALLVAGTFVVAAPLGAPLLGLDPLAGPRVYGPLLEPFSRGDHGLSYRTHHVPIRTPLLGDRIAEAATRRMGPGSRRAARRLPLAEADLSWTSIPGGACGPVGGTWDWETHAVGARLAHRALIDGGFRPQFRDLDDSPLAIVRIWAPGCGESRPRHAQAPRWLVDSALRTVGARLPGAKLWAVDDRIEFSLSSIEPQENPLRDFAGFVVLAETP